MPHRSRVTSHSTIEQPTLIQRIYEGIRPTGIDRRLGLVLIISALAGLSNAGASAEEPPEKRDSRAAWNSVFERTAQRGIEWKTNEFLMNVVAEREPGRALDIGMGQGRNALFLAEAGWQVTGFDISDTAIEQAHQAATAAGLELDARVADINAFEYGSQQWDLVVIMYMHGLIVPSVPKIIDSLAPNGLVVIEGFHRDLGVEGVGGGFFGFHTNQLPRLFDDLRILYYEDVTSEADWGRQNPGDKPIVRFVARKVAENTASEDTASD